MLNGCLEGDPDLEIRGVNGVEEAAEGEITFLSHKKYLAALKDSKCTAAILPEGVSLETGKAVISVKNPYLAFAKLLGIFHPPIKETPGVSSQSVVSDSAVLGKDVTIYPLVYVGENAKIGDGTVLFPGVFVGDHSTIGFHGVIHSHVSIYAGMQIGDRVVIHSGAVIGSDGFGFVPDETGKRNKIPQVGKVVLEDDVEIGANTCIDRGTMGETRIRKGVKLDNLIQIAHNCTVGEDSVLAAQVGISGSTSIGKRAMMGGQVGVADHVEMGDDVMIVAQSGVPSDLPGKQIYAGSPTVKRNVWRKTQMALPQLPDLIKKVRAMEKRIEELEKND